MLSSVRTILHNCLIDLFYVTISKKMYPFFSFSHVIQRNFVMGKKTLTLSCLWKYSFWSILCPKTFTVTELFAILALLYCPSGKNGFVHFNIDRVYTYINEVLFSTGRRGEEQISLYQLLWHSYRFLLHCINMNNCKACWRRYEYSKKRCN